MGLRNKYIKSGVWYIIGNLLIKGISFLTLPIFTRLLSQSDFGQFNLFLSYENILNVILGLGMAGTIKTAFFDLKEDFNKYFGSVLSLTILCSLLFDCALNIILIFAPLNRNGWGIGIYNILVFYSLASALYNLLSMRYVILGDYKQNLGMSFFYTISSVLLSVALCYVIFEDKRYLARICGNAIPLIIMTYSLTIIYIAKGKTLYNSAFWKYAIRLGFPLIFHSLSMVIMQQADTIMVNGFCGSETTAIYSLACTISSILTIVQSSVDNSWSPWFYKCLDNKDYSSLMKNNDYVIAIFTYLTVGFNLISPELVKITSPSSYSNAIYALIPLNISVYASFMYMFAVNKEYFFKKTKFIAFGTIIATLIDVALNAIMIPYFGFVMAAYTTLISKLVLFLIHTFISYKVDPHKVVKMRSLFYGLLIVSIISVVALLIKDLWLIRYSLIGIISIIGFTVFKKRDVNLLHLGK